MYFEKRASKKSKKGYTWTVLFYYTDSSGLKKRYKKSGFETKAEAQKHGSEMEKAIAMTGRKPEVKTLSAVYNEWYELNKDRLANNTLVNYKTLYRHLEPIQNMPIHEINYAILQGLFNSLDMAKGTKNIIKALLLNCYKHAIKSGYTQNNPAQYIELTGREKKPAEEALELSEVEEICSHIKSRNAFKAKACEIFVWIGYYTGLRSGEILALEWSDIDFNTGHIAVHRRRDQRTQSVTDQLKTKSSTAIIPLCIPLREILEDWQRANSNELILCNRDGSILSYQTVSQCLRRAGKDAGIPFHCHMLRHTFITNLVRSGADPKTAAQLARHSNVSITLDVYTQMSRTDLDTAVNRAFPSPKKDPNLPNLAA